MATLPASSAGPLRTLLLADRSPRLVTLGRWLDLLGAGAEGSERPRAVTLDDLGDLFEPRWRGVSDLMLFVDAEALPVEEVGLLSRWIAREPGARLCLVGEEADRAGAKRLLKNPQLDPGAEWLSWPPDVPRLERLLAAAPPQDSDEPALFRGRPSRPEAPAGTPSAESPERRGARVRDVSPPPPAVDSDIPEEALRRPSEAELAELREIEFILGRPGPRSTAETPRPAQTAPSGTATAAPASPPATEPERSLDPLASALEAAARQTRRGRDEEADEEAELAPQAPAEADVEAPAEEEDALAPEEAAAASELGSKEAARRERGTTAPWFKDQVADLADIAQRIELGLSAARSADFEATLHATPVEAEEGAHTERKLSSRLDELETEVLRLSQFTRTLGFLAAPPGPGVQTLDLRALVSEWVQTQAAHYDGRGEGAPRFLLRVDEPLHVRSDKSLLAQAFDALFYVARRATPPGHPVRVRARAVEEASAETEIEFERGSLADRTPEEITRPYALRRVLPELGPNALDAARSILEGQGGRVALEDAGSGRLRWRVGLPLSDA